MSLCCMVQSSHPAMPAVATAMMQNMRLAIWRRWRSHANPCTPASVSEAAAVIDQMIVTQFTCRVGISQRGGPLL